MSTRSGSRVSTLVFPLLLLSAGCGGENGDANDGGSGGSSAHSGGTGASTGGAGGANAGGSGTATGGTSTNSGGSGTAGSGSGGTSGGTGAGGTSGNTGAGGSGIIPAEGCDSNQEPGTWANVTPGTMKMSGDFIDGPIGALVDPVHTSDIYVVAQYDGCWKSTNCGITWEKVSTGENAGALNSGRQWYSAIDPNPDRDPETPPTLYATAGFGAGGVWKSTNGGVDWANVWNTLYKADGTTNITSDVGSDVSGVMIAGSTGPDHLLAFLHGYWGSGDNNGVFESTDGGGTWRVHVSSNFAFQAHGDTVFPVNDSTWVVGHGEMFRTTDSGSTWNSAGNVGTAAVGRFWWFSGDTIYAGSDAWGHAFKSTDQGASWVSLDAGGHVFWIVATATNAYLSDSVNGGGPHIWHASLDNDSEWTDDGNPEGMNANGSRATVTFDGDHYIIIAAQETGGLWRYVEP